MRTLTLVGRQRGNVIQFSRRCAWGGGHWMSAADLDLAATGAKVTHCICPEHAAEFEAQLDAMGPPPTTAA